MSKMTYSEQLRHPLWQRKRLEVLSLAGWACQCCHATDQTLHVHHKRYAKGRMAWEYSIDELAALCETCHQEMHHADDVFREVLAHCPVSGPRSLRKAMAVAAGFIGIHEATPDHLICAGLEEHREELAGYAAASMVRHMSELEICGLGAHLDDPLLLSEIRLAIQAAEKRLSEQVRLDMEGGQ